MCRATREFCSPACGWAKSSRSRPARSPRATPATSHTRRRPGAPGSTGPRAPAARTCCRKKASAQAERSGVLPAVRRNLRISRRFRAIPHPRSDNTTDATPRNPNAMIRKGADTAPNKTRYDIRRLSRLLNVRRLMSARTIAVLAFMYAVACPAVLANCDPAKGAVDIDSCLVKGRTAVHGRWQVLGLKEWQKNGDIRVTKQGFTWGKCRRIPAEIAERGDGKFLLKLLNGQSCDL